MLRMMTGDNPQLEPMSFEGMLRNVLVAGTMFVISPLDSDKFLAVSLWFSPGTKIYAT